MSVKQKKRGGGAMRHLGNTVVFFTILSVLFGLGVSTAQGEVHHRRKNVVDERNLSEARVWFDRSEIKAQAARYGALVEKLWYYKGHLSSEWVGYVADHGEWASVPTLSDVTMVYGSPAIIEEIEWHGSGEYASQSQIGASSIRRLVGWQVRISRYDPENPDDPAKTDPVQAFLSLEKGVYGNVIAVLHWVPLGRKGDPGPKGDTGAQGIQGLPGEKGERGEDGVVIPSSNLVITKQLRGTAAGKSNFSVWFEVRRTDISAESWLAQPVPISIPFGVGTTENSISITRLPGTYEVEELGASEDGWSLENGNNVRQVVIQPGRDPAPVVFVNHKSVLSLGEPAVEQPRKKGKSFFERYGLWIGAAGLVYVLTRGSGGDDEPPPCGDTCPVPGSGGSGPPRTPAVID